ncbi:hypothetical protein DEFDS_1126 [Deferribacter desulfuricans SSM1]|uniref:histidine kinase n=2 Tax=Deferribacter TaxID=53572 RepID=D3PDC2_DEFDS|nr:hypothetical protein DEFDS_1126 [Deferribacter desulfuricans SSM1]
MFMNVWEGDLMYSNEKVKEVLTSLGFIYVKGFIKNEKIFLSDVSDKILQYIDSRDMLFKDNFFREVLAENFEDTYEQIIDIAKKNDKSEVFYKFKIKGETVWAYAINFYKHDKDKIYFETYLKDITKNIGFYVEKREITYYAEGVLELLDELMGWEYISDESLFDVLKKVFKTNKFVLVSPYGKDGYKFYLDKVYESEISDLKELLNSDSCFVNNFYCDEKYYIFRFYLGYFLVMFKGDLQELFIERIKVVLKIIEIVYEYINKKKRLRDAIEENNKLIEEIRLNYLFIKEILDNLNSAVIVLDEDDNIVLSNEIFKKSFTEEDLNIILKKSKDKFEYKDKHYKVFLREINIEENLFKIILLIDITDIVKYEREFSRMDRLASIGQLTAGIAHDFNNILTGISGMTYAVKSMESDKNKIKLLTNIENLVDRAANIIRQLLDFARKSEGDVQKFDLIPYLKEYIKMLKETFPKNITINLKYDNKDKFVVEMDPVHLDRIMMNLCVNAKDAIGDNEGKIDIQISRIKIVDKNFKDLIGLVKNGEYILISVSDNGCGIPDDVKGKIYDPYFTTKEHGNGLGLAQVYGLVKNNGGYITFESKKGEGTTFYVLLPYAVGEEDNKDEYNAIDNERNQKFKDIKILLIDDEKFIVESISLYLKQVGMDVDVITKPVEALDLLNKNKYDVVITDYSLPGVKSEEFVEKIKTYCDKVIVISGFMLSDIGLPFLKKPFKFDELTKLIEELLAENNQ